MPYAIIQGTFQFLARDVLKGGSHLPKHDLESFFWLLAWISFRYVSCGCTGWIVKSLGKVLDEPCDAQWAKERKIAWLGNISLAKKIVNLTGYKPLMQLLDKLARLLLKLDLDYTRMLRVFEDALVSQGWPEDDPHLGPKCEFDPISSSEHDAPLVIARTNPGRPTPLLNGWNRNLWPIDIKLKDSEDKNGLVSRSVPHVVNLNRTRTSLTKLCQPIATFSSTKQLVEAIRDAIKGMLLKDGRASLWLINRRMNIGHKLLAECGLLHQDISANSVSLSNSGRFKGFLHDFDHSICERRGQDDDCQLGALSYRIPRTVS